jgi:hypothetical protein
MKITNYKSQMANKFQMQRFQCSKQPAEAGLVIGILRIGACLGFVAWDLGFRFAPIPKEREERML